MRGHGTRVAKISYLSVRHIRQSQILCLRLRMAELEESAGRMTAAFVERVYFGRRLRAIASSMPLRKLMDSGAE